jgi:hypothetical protein
VPALLVLLLGVIPVSMAAADTQARTTDNVCDPPFVSAFDDIDGSAHEDNVLCMADYGITEGTGDGTSYSPRREVTRAQMASFIARYIEHYTGETLPLGDDRFDDVPEGFAHYANIHKLLEAGVTEGTAASDGASFAPQQSVTRGQMASFISRASSFIEDGQARPEHQPERTEQDVFSDDDGSVHEANINALAAVGIVQGFADGTYRPGNAVVRDQMASFVMRGYDWAVEVGLGAAQIKGSIAFEALLPVPGPFEPEVQSLDGQSFVVGHTIEDVRLAVEDVINPGDEDLELGLDLRAPGTTTWDGDCEDLFTADGCTLIEDALDAGNPFTADTEFFAEQELQIPPDAATGEWKLRFQVTDEDGEVAFAEVIAITVKAQIQAEIFFEANDTSVNGAVFEQGQVLEDMHLEVELVDNPDGEEFTLFYIPSPPDVMFPDGPEFCDALFAVADCEALDTALADTNPISDTTIYLDADDGVAFTIDEDATPGEWDIGWGLMDADGEVRAFFMTFFDVIEG